MYSSTPEPTSTTVCPSVVNWSTSESLADFCLMVALPDTTVALGADPLNLIAVSWSSPAFP
jgi:hypothetical protein